MNRSYFTIAEIMLVIAAAAIFLSAGRVVAQERGLTADIRQLMILRAVSGTIIGVIVGVGIGLSRRRWIVGAILGFFGGGIVGGLAATILSVPQNIPLAPIGSAVLLLGGVAVRLFSRRDVESGDR
ncbi:MAG: hypothetical protein IT426_09740 [Pirellulales bacterium]|nr:hypothetical protein [Pirellulales bacterium]